ncbi:C-reactive protein isoform X3 [Pongo abelii]|uniref:CRP isoform 4 n=1 Tax=Pongo abelii TaxID=9601 RepID=A0A2J8VHE2_PONAB|nr:C-reactive protein isoform X3 [Pongo abelii]PNJ56943.1 CRP isoform 4 [Pongo abelii]
MEKLLCFLVLTSLSHAFGQTDMSRKAFVFPKESDTSYVSLKTQLTKPLKAFTVCLHFYTELSSTRGPNVLNWRALKYEVEGEVFTKPQLWP